MCDTWQAMCYNAWQRPMHVGHMACMALLKAINMGERFSLWEQQEVRGGREKRKGGKEQRKGGKGKEKGRKRKEKERRKEKKKWEEERKKKEEKEEVLHSE